MRSGRWDSGDRRGAKKGELVTTKMVISDLKEPKTNDRDKQAKTVRGVSGPFEHHGRKQKNQKTKNR